MSIILVGKVNQPSTPNVLREPSQCGKQIQVESYIDITLHIQNGYW